MASRLNKVFDERDDYLSPILVEIEGHRFLSGVLELQVLYYNGDQAWYPLDIVNDDDPHDTSNCILSNDLGLIRR